MKKFNGECERDSGQREEIDIRRAPIRNPAAICVAIALLLTPLLITIASHAAKPGSTGDPIALKSYVDSKISELEKKLTAMIGGAAQTQDASQGTSAGAGAAGAAAGTNAAVGTNAAAGTNAGIASDMSALAARLIELEKKIEKLSDENRSLAGAVQRLSATVNATGGAAAIPGSGTDDTGGTGASDVGAAAGLFDPAGTASAGYANSSDRFNAVEVFANQRVMLGAGAEIVLRTGKALAIRGEYGGLVDLISGKDLDAGENVPQNHLILSPRGDNRGIKVSEDAWLLIKGQYELR